MALLSMNILTLGGGGGSAEESGEGAEAEMMETLELGVCSLPRGAVGAAVGAAATARDSWSAAQAMATEPNCEEAHEDVSVKATPNLSEQMRAGFNAQTLYLVEEVLIVRKHEQRNCRRCRWRNRAPAIVRSDGANQRLEVKTGIGMAQCCQVICASPAYWRTSSFRTAQAECARSYVANERLRIPQIALRVGIKEARVNLRVQ